MKYFVFLLMLLTAVFAGHGWQELSQEYQYFSPEYVYSYIFALESLGLLLVTVLPLVFLAYYRDWNRIKIWVWWTMGAIPVTALLALRLQYSFAITIPGPRIVGKLIVPALALTVLGLVVFGQREESVEYPHGRSVNELVIVGFLVFLIYPVTHHRWSLEAETKNNTHSIELSAEKYAKHLGGPPRSDQIFGGVCRDDELVSLGYMPEYPKNSFTRNAGRGYDFFAGGNYIPDFLDLRLLPPEQLDKWKEIADYNPMTGSRRMVNVRPIYRQVMRKFRKRKKTGKLPEDLKHPFAGHFLYLQNQSQENSYYLMPFGAPNSAGKDLVDQDLQLGSDGDDDGLIEKMEVSIATGEGIRDPNTTDSPSRQ